MAPAITLAREINPLWVTELITHEVEITAIDCRGGNQTDHLMQSNTTMSHFVFITLLEMPVHICINQTEDDSFIAHQCLVMTLTVRDGLSSERRFFTSQKMLDGFQSSSFSSLMVLIQ